MARDSAQRTSGARARKGARTQLSDGVVRAEALRLFREVVLDLGGDPDRLLRKHRIDPQRLAFAEALISYRDMVSLLEQTSIELGCRDFGLRLAARQGGIAVLGPLEVAMRNASTVGEAYRYCATHLQVYSPAVQIGIEADARSERHYMRFDVLLANLQSKRQVVENALCLTHHAVLALSGGRFGAREVWFEHERGMPRAVYQRYFDGPVSFRRPMNAVFFNNADLAQPIQGNNPRIYAMASTYIDLQYPPPRPEVAPRARLVVERLLPRGRCSSADVAVEMGMHPRTLQRRLKAEDSTLEEIRDAVRREMAKRYLVDSDLPIARVAAMLGYSETSVLTRSCKRWFRRSPRQVRLRGRVS